MSVCACLSQGGYTIKCVSLETRPFPCHLNCLLHQEVLRNYRDAACSNGVPTQPIIWRDSPCQGVIVEGMELSFDVKKGATQ